MLKRLIRDRSKDIEDEFAKLDRASYGELTQQMLFDLFKRFVQLTNWQGHNDFRLVFKSILK